MGGHGALTIALKQPAVWRSVSAFSPICNPTKVPWGPQRRDAQRSPRRWVTGLIHTRSKAFEGPPGLRRGRPRARRCALVKKGQRSDAISGTLKARTTTFWLVMPISSNPAAPEARRVWQDRLDLRFEAGYDRQRFFVGERVDDRRLGGEA